LINRRNIRRTVIERICALLTLSSLWVAAPVAAQNVAGSISALTGSATVTRGGATIPAANGAKVNVGDRLATAAASNLTVTFSDGSQVQLTDSSTLTIDEDTLDANGARASTKISLFNGLARSLVRTTPGTPPNFEIHTPNAVAAVRGTDFDIDHQNGVQDKKYPGCYEFSHVSVREGTVEVYNPANPSSPKVEVEKGHKATVPCSGAIVVGAVSAAIFSLGAPGGIGAGAVAAGAAAVVGGGVAGGIVASGGGGTGGGGSSNPQPVSPSE
jgi:ferric-dicitrate binding protein FerR (iron transport regulator)